MVVSNGICGRDLTYTTSIPDDGQVEQLQDYFKELSAKVCLTRTTQLNKVLIILTYKNMEKEGKDVKLKDHTGNEVSMATANIMF